MLKNTGFKVCAVIPAAGKGTRMNMDFNKQYIEINGIPILARTLQVFEKCDAISGIVLVVNAQDIMWCRQNIVFKYNLSKVSTIASGGASRQESVFKALKCLPEDCDIVVIHDGARPFVDDKMILASIQAAAECGAGCVGVPAKDTIKIIDEDNYVCTTPPRDFMWSIQTPQTFKYDIIMKAHSEALNKGIEATDDASLVEIMNYKVKLVEGSYRNFKITTKEDLLFAEALLCKER